jgi:cation transport ATPase
VGSGLAAKFGILAVGGGEAFQEMAQVDLIIFDKTGTLTEGGDLRVANAEVFSSHTKLTREAIFGVAGALETSSSHPLATAIRVFCESQGALPAHGSEFEETSGRGLQGYFAALKCSAVIGNEAWMTDHGAIISNHVSGRLESWKSQAKSVVLLAVRDDGEIHDEGNVGFFIAAIFAVTDPVRPESRDVVSAFQQKGISTWMVSGDNIITAQSVAAAVGIPRANVIAGVLPHEKVCTTCLLPPGSLVLNIHKAEKVAWLQRTGTKRETAARWKLPFVGRRLNDRCVVAMLGDGINDAPVSCTSTPAESADCSCRLCLLQMLGLQLGLAVRF